jgi:S-adenosylmethionine/arginine decarboxylase-like enzyme
MFLEENYKIDKVGFPILNLMARKSERFLWNIEPGMKLYLLGESHFAIHTFPEHGKSYIELSSCNENMYIKCVEVLKKILKID